MVSRIDVHFHDPIASHAQEFLFLVPIELDDEKSHSELRQALPRPDVAQLGIHQREVFDIGMGFQHPHDGFVFQLLGVSGGQILVRVNVVRVDRDCRCLRGLLHTQERLDAGYFAVV